MRLIIVGVIFSWVSISYAVKPAEFSPKEKEVLGKGCDQGYSKYQKNVTSIKEAALRKAHGLSNDELADLMDQSSALAGFLKHVWGYELKGRGPGYRTLDICSNYVKDLPSADPGSLNEETKKAYVEEIESWERCVIDAERKDLSPTLKQYRDCLLSFAGVSYGAEGKKDPKRSSASSKTKSK